MWTAAFRALGTNVRLQTADTELVPTLRSLVGTYGPPAHGPNLTYRFETGPSHDLWRDEELIYVAKQKIELPPAFEWDLYQRLIAISRDNWVLHSAALAIDGGALLLVGPSGGGKSTLSLALLGRQAAYLSDEYAVVKRDGLVRGVARPISFGIEGLAIAPPPDFQVNTYPICTSDGTVRHHFLVHPPPAQVLHDPLPLRLIVLLNRVSPEQLALRPLSAAVALREVWASSITADREALDVAGELLGQHRVHQLDAGDIEHTCDEILELYRRQV